MKSVFKISGSIKLRLCIFKIVFHLFFLLYFILFMNCFLLLLSKSPFYFLKFGIYKIDSCL